MCDSGNRFNFGRPDLQYSAAAGGSSYGRGKSNGSWCATLLVNGRRIGMGEARNKKDAQNRAYLDVAQYLESCDPDLWGQWTEKKMMSKGSKGGDGGAHIVFDVDPRTDEELRETVWESRDSHLYKRAKAMLAREKEKADREKERLRFRAGQPDAMDVDSLANPQADRARNVARRQEQRAPMLAKKSADLLARLQNYQVEPDRKSVV